MGLEAGGPTSASTRPVAATPTYMSGVTIVADRFRTLRRVSPTAPRLSTSTVTARWPSLQGTGRPRWATWGCCAPRTLARRAFPRSPRRTNARLVQRGRCKTSRLDRSYRPTPRLQMGAASPHGPGGYGAFGEARGYRTFETNKRSWTACATATPGTPKCGSSTLPEARWNISRGEVRTSPLLEACHDVPTGAPQ